MGHISGSLKFVSEIDSRYLVECVLWKGFFFVVSMVVVCHLLTLTFCLIFMGWSMG